MCFTYKERQNNCQVSKLETCSYERYKERDSFHQKSFETFENGAGGRYDNVTHICIFNNNTNEQAKYWFIKCPETFNSTSIKTAHKFSLNARSLIANVKIFHNFVFCKIKFP